MKGLTITGIFKKMSTGLFEPRGRKQAKRGNYFTTVRNFNSTLLTDKKPNDTNE